MSILHSIHDFKPFDSKTSKPYEGQRLAKVTYKTSKKNPTPKFPSICVSIPQVKASLSAELLPVIQERLEHAQDGIIKELHEAGKNQVSDAELSQENCIKYLIQELEGQRLTKEDVENWFDSSLGEILQVAFADKLGVSDTPTPEQEAKILKSVGDYKEKFTALSGGRTFYSPVIAEKLLKVLELAESSDEIGGRFKNRLQKMTVQEQDTLDAL